MCFTSNSFYLVTVFQKNMPLKKKTIKQIRHIEHIFKLIPISKFIKGYTSPTEKQ